MPDHVFTLIMMKPNNPQEETWQDKSTNMVSSKEVLKCSII